MADLTAAWFALGGSLGGATIGLVGGWGGAALTDRFARRREATRAKLEFQLAAVLDAHECLRDMDVAMARLAGQPGHLREQDIDAYVVLTRLSTVRHRVLDIQLRATLADVAKKSEIARATLKKPGPVTSEMREAMEAYNGATEVAHNEIAGCLDHLMNSG
jgi:hypothetical protein